MFFLTWGVLIFYSIQNSYVYNSAVLCYGVPDDTEDAISCTGIAVRTSSVHTCCSPNNIGGQFYHWEFNDVCLPWYVACLKYNDSTDVC